MRDLTQIRTAIDKLDSDIIRLLAERSVLVSEAGKLKKDTDGVRDPARVGQVIENARKKAAGAGLDPSIAEEVYRAITGCFVRRELRDFVDRGPRGLLKDCGFTIRHAAESDRDGITAVFNHYVRNGFAAYPEQPVDGVFFDFMKKIIYGDSFFVMEQGEGKLAGFAFLKRYHAYPAFDRVAEVGYFILPEHTKKGLGTQVLGRLEDEARKQSIDTLLANVSSHNQPSLSFHEKHGFRECGRFTRVSRKFGQDVDIVWLQKFL